METQANGPVQTQAPEPVIQAENSLHEKLTQWVSNNEDNDPHAGTDLEAPKKEEAAPEPAQTEEAPLEIDEETPFFDIEYKTESGKELKKLSAKELREGWLAKQDYHRNIQKVKAQEVQLQEQVKQAQTQAQQQYLQQLETYRQAVIKLAAPEVANVDLNKLAQEDPAEAQRVFFKTLQLNQTLQAIQQEQQAATQKMEGQRKEYLAQAVQKARETLASEIPGWSDDLYRTVLKTGVEDYGFAPDEVSNVVDPRTIKLLHDAFQYRQLQKAKPAIEKKVVSVPKVVKPGSADKPNSSDAENEALRSLRKTGDWRAAAQAYLARQKRR